MAAAKGSEEPAQLERRNVELGPLFTAGVLLLAYGLLRRRALAVALGIGGIWLDQRSQFAALSRSVFERYQSRLLMTITSGSVIRQSAVIAPGRPASGLAL